MSGKIHKEKLDEWSCQFKKYSFDFAYIDHCGNVALRTKQKILIHSTSNKPKQPSCYKNRECSVWGLEYGSVPWIIWSGYVLQVNRIIMQQSPIFFILEVHKGVRTRRVHVSGKDMLLLSLSDKEIDDCVTWTKLLSGFTKTARFIVT